MTENIPLDLAELVDEWSAAARAYLDGDLPAYAAIARHSDDFTLTPPFGGEPRRGFDDSPEAVRWLAENFAGGTVGFEVFQTYASGDLAVLVATERQRGTLMGLPPQDWSLRLTLVFRREADGWHLVHRHADPLTRQLGLALFSELARGDHAAS